jgi:hypothetical protein
VTKVADQLDVAWEIASLLRNEGINERAGFVNFEQPTAGVPLVVAEGIETTTTNYRPSRILAVRSTLLLHRLIK